MAPSRTPSRPWFMTAGGITVMIRLTPKGGHDAVDGIEHRSNGQCVLKARVRASASEGEVNDALIRLMTRALAVPPRDISIKAGATSRIKRLTIAGDGPMLAAALEKIAAVR